MLEHWSMYGTISLAHECEHVTGNVSAQFPRTLSQQLVTISLIFIKSAVVQDDSCASVRRGAMVATMIMTNCQ